MLFAYSFFYIVMMRNILVMTVCGVHHILDYLEIH